MTDKSQLVKGFFENISLYLTYDYNLKIRKETVESFTNGKNFKNVLDVPCGTGAMSIPLLNRTEKLLLIDVSSNMVEFAKKNVPEEFNQKVEAINADFFKLDLPKESYDLVICLGILAHVNSPEELLKKITGLIKPGGLLIIQNTDSSHFYSKLISIYLGLKNIISKQPYKFNKVTAKFVEETLTGQKFAMKRCFRYNQSFLGLSNLFSNEKKYKMTRNFFGNAENQKHASWGSDYTYLFVKQ